MAGKLMSRPILYHYPESFSSQIVRLALVEKGVKWRGKIIDIMSRYKNYEPSYLSINPAGVVPTLRHKSGDITDSIAIALYVNNNFPGPMLVPTSQRERELMEQWVTLQQKFPERELMYSMMKGMRANFANKDIKQRKATIEKLAEKHEEFTPLYEEKYDDISSLERILSNENIADKHLHTLTAMLSMFEESARKNKWLAGNEYSLADVVWTVLLARLDMLGLSYLWTDGSHPFVEGYYKLVQERPSFKKAKIYKKVPLSSYFSILTGKIPGLRIGFIVLMIIAAGYGLAQTLKFVLA
jgi:glutathione S-transferase